MCCGCIGVYRKERLDESFREILRRYQKYVIEDTCWFSIELEYHMKPTYTDFERQQLTEVFGCFPEQVIWIFGEGDRIYVAAYEIIRHFGGLLKVNFNADRNDIHSCKGFKIEIYKKQWRNPLRHDPDYLLVDQHFIKDYYAIVSGDNFQKFKLDVFMPYA